MRVGDRYELLDRLGQGGMGTVWRAHDELLDRDVAVKEVLLPPDLGDAERRSRHARTIREARSAARLNHPGAVTVHDVVEHEGRPWIVMQLVAAPSLQNVIDTSGPLAPRRVAALGRQMLDALRAAHAAGIEHRDIKPSNVLVADGDHAVITDFGIAALEGDPSLTGTGVLIGSPAYMAPERARGDGGGPAADLWSLGATLYAAVEGRSPFERSGPVSTLAAIMAEEMPPPRLAGPLTPVLAGLLRRDPSQRMTAAEAAPLLTQVAEGTEPAALTMPVPQHLALPAATARFEAPATERYVASGAERYLASGAERYPAPGSSRRPATPALAGALAGALLVAAFGAVWLLGHHSASKAGTTSAGSSASPAASSGSSSVRPQVSASAAVSSAADATSEQWTTRSESGYSVSVPSSWSRRVSGDNVFYQDPTTRLLLQIGTTPWYSDPRTQAETVDSNVSKSFQGYRESAITPLTYQGVPAADLSFAYDRSTGTERVNDRFFRVNGRTFAVYFRMPAEEWQNSPKYLDPIFNGFHVS